MVQLACSPSRPEPLSVARRHRALRHPPDRSTTLKCGRRSRLPRIEATPDLAYPGGQPVRMSAYLRCIRPSLADVMMLCAVRECIRHRHVPTLGDYTA